MRPADVVEVSCVVDQAGVKPLPIGVVPEHQELLMRAVKQYERLTVEAILNRSRDTAVLALMSHPLVLSYSRATTWSTNTWPPTGTIRGPGSNVAARKTGLPTPYDILIEGGYFCDLIFTGLPGYAKFRERIYGTGFEIMAGAGFYYALALKRLGLRVGWSCDFGSDVFSRFVLDAVRREEIDDSLFRIHNFPIRCLTVSLSFPGERAFVSYVDEVAGPPLAALVRQYRPRCVLLGGLQTGPAHLDLVIAAHDVGALFIWIANRTR